MRTNVFCDVMKVCESPKVRTAPVELQVKPPLGVPRPCASIDSIGRMTRSWPPLPPTAYMYIFVVESAIGMTVFMSHCNMVVRW